MTPGKVEANLAAQAGVGTGINKLPTPIMLQELLHYLTGYPEDLKGYLIRGFSQGFSLGYSGVLNNIQSKNLKSAHANRDFVNRKISMEHDAGRLLGPFRLPPFPHYMISPLGVVPKKLPGQFRLIHHLSYPYGASINDGIPPELSTVKYETIDTAIAIIKRFGVGTHMMKTDVSSAFRIIPIHPADYCLTGFKWDKSFWFDKALCMGASSSCAIFSRFSEAIHWIAINKLDIPDMVHILDDFLALVPPIDTDPGRHLAKFLHMCDQIGLPMAPDKTLGPATCMVFAGIELDTISMEARLPWDKIDKCRTKLIALQHKKKPTLRELQSVLGLLNFACQVVVPGRAFLRRLIQLTIGVKHPRHHIALSRGARLDIELWLSFLHQFNGRSILLDNTWVESDTIQMYTDAASTVGYAGILGHDYFYGTWPDTWKRFNIAVLELFPIVISIEIWKHILKNKRILFKTDNEALVPVINKQTSKDPRIMILVRHLVLICLTHNIHFKAQHISSSANFLADALSRSQVQRFRDLGKQMAPEATTIPPEFLPVNYDMR